MALDYTNTFELLQAIDRMYRPTTLFRDTFFGREHTFASESVLMDYRKGSRKMAPFVSRNGGAANVARDGFITKQYTPPMMAPARVTTIGDIEKRGFGESIISSRTPADREQELAARDISELMDMNVRRIEWMAVQTMLNAGFTVSGTTADGATSIIDNVSFGEFTHKKTLSGNDMWSNTAADIYGCLKAMYETVATDSGYAPSVLITTSKTISYMLKNEDLLKYLLRPSDQLKVATFAPRIESEAVTNVGAFLDMNGLQVYAYDGVYEDESGKLQKYIPDGYVIMARKNIGAQLFGAVTQLESDGAFHTYEGAYVPKVWDDVNSDTKKIRLATRCVVKPDCVDDWYTLKAY